MAAGQGVRRGLATVLALILGLGAGSVYLLVSLGGLGAPARAAPWWYALLITAGYAVAEKSVFHVEYRREAITFSLSEVPTVFALAFLDPLTAVVARLVGSLAVIVPTMRPRIDKLCFNAALFAFETALAFSLCAAITGPSSDGDAELLVAIAIATCISMLVGPLMVVVVIASFEGDLVARLRDEFRTSGIVGPVSAAVAAVSLAPALLSIELTVLSAVPIVAVWIVLLRHGRLAQRHRDLEDVHDFSAIVGRSLRVDDVALAALDAALDVLRADRGTVQIYASDGSIAVQRHVNGGVHPAPQDVHDPEWRSVLEGSGAVAVHADDERVVVGADEPAPCLAIPIRDRGGPLGVLLVSDRHGAEPAFSADDRSQANRLGNQLAAHVRNVALYADIEFAALHDGLTGRLNRRAFDERLAIEIGRDDDMTAAVLMLDLDRFKEVNDTFGHHVGDRLLIEFGRRLDELIETADVVARFGGDEFAVFVRRDGAAAVRDLAESIVQRSYDALALGGYDIVVAVSVGVAFVDAVDHDVANVLRRADIAMYAAKNARSGYEIYRTEIDRRTPERLSLLGALRDALSAGDLEVHYQPKIDVMTSSVVGAEALVRWEHPTRGRISPPEFIAVAEESGLIRELTDHVLATAAASAAGWRESGFDLGVAVNLSTLDLIDERLPDRTVRCLSAAGLDPELLTFEITESALMVDIPRTMATIERLRELGVRMSLDDFGTGYSSLKHLRRLPVNELKIDRSFVANVLLDAQDEVIVRSTIELGHNLGLDVVAEGIENEPVLEHLVGLGCDLGQGYGISRPLPADLFHRWLSTTNCRIRPQVESGSSLSATRAALAASPRRP